MTKKPTRLSKLVLLLIPLVLLICLCVIFSNVFKDSGDGTNEPPEETYPVSGIDPDALGSFSVSVTETGEEGVTVSTHSFSLEGEKWVWDKRVDLPLDGELMSAIASAIPEATSSLRLDAVAPADLQKYGLDAPYIELSFTHSGGETRYIIGNKNSFNGLYYLADADDTSTVYMVDGSVCECFLFEITDLVELEALPSINPAAVSSLEYKFGDKTVSLTRYPNGNPEDYTDAYIWYWSLGTSTALPLDPTVAQTLDTALQTLSFTACVSFTADERAEYGMDAPGRLTVNFKDDNDEAQVLSLSFGKTDGEGEYYISKDGGERIYSSSGSEVFSSIFEADADTICPNELASFNTALINSMTFTAGDSTLTVNIAHTEDGETFSRADGGYLDITLFNTLLSLFSKTEFDAYTSEHEETSTTREVLITVELVFDLETVKTATLTVSDYSDGYDRVTFMGRDSGLIEPESTELLINALLDVIAMQNA